MRCPSRVSRHRCCEPSSSCCRCSQRPRRADAQQAGPTPDPTRFEKSVLAYEAADATAPAQRNAILWLATRSSSAGRRCEDLAGYNVINRGVDSFQSPDLLDYTDRLVLRYKPRMIVLHIGGNDVHNGRTPDQVLGDFKAFVGKVRARRNRTCRLRSPASPRAPAGGRRPTSDAPPTA